MNSKLLFDLATLGAALLFLASNPASAKISLGTAQNFSVLGYSTITNTGPTVVNGNVGLTPGSSITGFPPGTILNGAMQINNVAAVQAKTDINSAFTNLNALPCSATFGGGTDIATLSPINAAATPVLCFTSSALVTGPVVINGVPGDTIVFKIASTLTTSNNATMTLAGGMSCDQVQWGVGSSATIGVNSTVVGDILALASISLNTGASAAGRAFALNGAVTLDTNVVNPCSNFAPTASSLAINGTAQPGQLLTAAIPITMPKATRKAFPPSSGTPTAQAAAPPGLPSAAPLR